MDDLNNNELEALRVLWEQGTQKPAVIQEEFGWAIDNGTLRSVLRVLMTKGYVTRRKEGKAFLYSAKAPREKMLSRMVRQMAHVFTGGSKETLLLHLVESEELSPEAIAELKRIAQKRGKAKS